MGKLFIADEKDIRSGSTMDIYFGRTKRILEAKGLERTNVWAEFTASALPNGWPWAVFCGLEEVMRLMENKPITLASIPEGTIFRARSPKSVRIPLMSIHGAYTDFGVDETAMLGMICQPSGVATEAARTKIAAKGKPVLEFGARRMHPAITGVLDRSAFIGGCDAVSTEIGGQLTGVTPIGTTPHALMLVMGSNEAAFKAFDEIIEPEVPRIMLVDTFSDETLGAMDAVNAVKDLQGVRLDTPSSRRGNFKELINEVRWTLDLHGYKDIKIIASGGLNEKTVAELADSCVSTFAVGTSICNAPTLDLSMDIIEKEGVPFTKRGKFAGRKYAYRCPDCLAMDTSLSPNDDIKCSCGCKMELAESIVIKDGKRTGKARSAAEIRSYVLEQIKQLGEL
jgi:nicotinate phosphoribosyltransferase